MAIKDKTIRVLLSGEPGLLYGWLPLKIHTEYWLTVDGSGLLSLFAKNKLPDESISSIMPESFINNKSTGGDPGGGGLILDHSAVTFSGVG